METKTSKRKEIRVPGPDHPITISPVEGKVRVTVAGRIVAESTEALRLEEKGYPPVYYMPRNEEYVCRKVCHPICCVIPTLAVAGRIIVRMRYCPQYDVNTILVYLAKASDWQELYRFST